MKIVKILSHLILTLAFVTYIAYQFRTDPIAMISGKKVSGEEVAYPADWSFSDEHPLFAVETRPGNEHSVTTIGFIHDGDLHIPAMEGSTKDWTQYVLSNPRARIKIGEKVYPVTLTRRTDVDIEAVRESVAAKYPDFGSGEAPPDVWLFRVSAR